MVVSRKAGFAAWVGKILALALLAPLLAAAQSTVQCSITTQNLVPGGAATAGSACEIRGAIGTLTAAVTGTYTASGGLSVQVSGDSSAWVTLGATTTVTRDSTGATTATIASAQTGTYSISGVTGKIRVRVTALGAVTGTAVVTLNAVPFGGGGGGGSGGGGGAVTVADGADVAQGTTSDAACTTDNGTCTKIAIEKRIAQNLTTINTTLGTANTQLPAALGQTTPSGSLSTTGAVVSSATLANVSASASNVTCLASNSSRAGAIILNDSATATLYVKLGATASTTSHTFQLSPGATLTLPNFPIYTGIIDCIWSAASGAARVTEF